MSLALLETHRRVWEKKKILRLLYEEWFDKIARELAEGKSIDIGSGSARLKERVPGVLTADILPAPWVDLVFDAHRMPFAEEEIGNLILFDVLHHLENPVVFFREAERVVKKGGRLIFMEPYVSWFSYPAYRWLHQEPMDMTVDPFRVVQSDPERKAFDGNQAIPTLMFKKYWDRFQKEFPAWRLVKRETLASFVYPLSGGFSRPSLIPAKAYRFARACENFFGFASAMTAFRIFCVLEKNKES